MKVILLKAVQKVGIPGQVVEVSEGYARNSLFPRKLAVQATDAALDALAKKKASALADKAIRKALLDKAVQELNGTALTYEARANEQGSLFSKIDAADIAEYLERAHRLALDPACIILPGGSIKKLGKHEIRLKEGEYEGSFTLEVANK